ncbi:MAG: CCA tRNA nucleotidyltransferase [Planctomycetes bacterium]|nr:CCA tRNA nucleotidyltransferase [Planctomycetota bacterium]
MDAMDAFECGRQVIRVLRAAGHQALLAGGCVRDRLLGEEPADYDVATSARPEEVIALFGRTERIGVQFGVVLVLVGGRSVEVATFRSDGDYRDGRRPVRVYYTGLEADARRRDFTINALYLDPETSAVIDLVGGRRDLEDRVLRTVGDARARMEEDRLRMLRAVRFAVRFGLRVEPEIRAACRALAPRLAEVARERITDELWRMAAGPAPDRALVLLADLGLLERVLPGVTADPQKLGGLGRLPCPRPAAVGLAGWLWAVAPAVAAGVLERLRLARADRRAVEGLLERAPRLGRFAALDVAAQKRLVRDPAFPDALALAAAMRGAEDPGVREARRAQAAWSAADLDPPRFLDGADLVALGVPQGPAVGELLRALEDEALRGRLPDVEAARRFVRAHRPG